VLFEPSGEVAAQIRVVPPNPAKKKKGTKKKKKKGR
jgi:hypothetical protein